MEDRALGLQEAQNFVAKMKMIAAATKPSPKGQTVSCMTVGKRKEQPISKLFPKKKRVKRKHRL
jgi:hypothetical protein